VAKIIVLGILYSNHSNSCTRSQNGWGAEMFLHYNEAAFHRTVFLCCFALADSIDPLIIFKDIW